MSTEDLKDYYRKETVYQRIVQSKIALDLLTSAAGRIYRGVRDYTKATGETYTYNNASYPQEIPEDSEITLESASLLTGNDTLTYRLRSAGITLFIGNEAADVKDKGQPFVSLENRRTARKEVKKLVEETAEVMDDLMAKLISAHYTKIPEDNMGRYLTTLEVLDLLMTRVALAGSPPEEFFKTIQDSTGRDVSGLKAEVASHEKRVEDLFGVPQTVHMEIGTLVQSCLQFATDIDAAKHYINMYVIEDVKGSTQKFKLTLKAGDIHGGSRALDNVQGMGEALAELRNEAGLTPGQVSISRGTESVTIETTMDNWNKLRAYVNPEQSAVKAHR